MVLSSSLSSQVFLQNAVISLLVGTLLSQFVPIIHPSQYGCHGDNDIDSITLGFSRLVLGVQLALAGVQLPSRYLSTARRSLFYLLGPGLVLTWLMSGLLVWWIIPRLGFIYSLAIAACVAPTDPVLSNAIVHGRFAELNTPVPLQRLILAEAGLNDGLGYPFLFFALHWIKGSHYRTGLPEMLAIWTGETWGYVVIFSIIYGAVAGYVTRRLLSLAVKKNWAEAEACVTFVIFLGLFVLGTGGMLGTDDILACFVAGCVFGWDDK